MIVAIFSGILVFLVIASAVFIAKGGIDLCEDQRMVKVLVGGFLSVYAVAALGLKLVLPALPANQVRAESLIPEELMVLGADIDIPLPWDIQHAFGAQ